MTGRPGSPPGDQPAADDDADQWREAARLRREHPAWVVIWLARSASSAATPGCRVPGATPR
jgi:hypothetical protein